MLVSIFSKIEIMNNKEGFLALHGMTVGIGMFGENALHFRIKPHSKVISSEARNLQKRFLIKENKRIFTNNYYSITNF
jgi:hypothetical protein